MFNLKNLYNENKKIDLTLLTEDEIDDIYESRISKTTKYTDLSLITGGGVHYDPDPDAAEETFSGSCVDYYIVGNINKNPNYDATKIDNYGYITHCDINKRNCAIRPVLKSPEIFSKLTEKILKTPYKVEIYFGEYPQNVADSKLQSILESEYNKGMKKTGRTYTFNSIKFEDCDSPFNPITYDEYEYNGKKYVRVKANCDWSYGYLSQKINETSSYYNNNIYWLEVSPIKWTVNYKYGMLISDKALLSGIRFNGMETSYNGDFNKTEIKNYLDKYMMHDLFQNEPLYQSIMSNSSNDFYSKEDLYSKQKSDEGKKSLEQIVDEEEQEIIKMHQSQEIIKIKEENERKINEEAEGKTQEILNLINDLNKRIKELESFNKDTANDYYRKLYHSINVSEDILYKKFKDHYEINENFKNILEYINLMLAPKNLKLSGIDWSKTNLSGYNPQNAYNKDLSNAKFNNRNLFGDFSNCDLRGSDISEGEIMIGIHNAITDENTKLPEERGMAL